MDWLFSLFLSPVIMTGEEWQDELALQASRACDEREIFPLFIRYKKGGEVFWESDRTPS